MKDQQVGRLFRLLRVRKGWRQEDAAAEAGISRKIAQKIEHGLVGTASLELVRKYAAAFELQVDIVVLGRGGDLARTIDEEHAMIVEQLATLVTACGWIVEPEASFNHYGDRGRMDILAYHPATRTLLIIEVKTVLTDLQEMFGSMNVKRRVAPNVARERSWEVKQVGSLLAIASSSASRQIVRQHETLFAPFITGDAAIRRWIKQPVGGVPMLLWVAAPPAKKSWNAGRARVRPKLTTKASSRGVAGTDRSGSAAKAAQRSRDSSRGSPSAC